MRTLLVILLASLFIGAPALSADKLQVKPMTGLMSKQFIKNAQNVKLLALQNSGYCVDYGMYGFCGSTIEGLAVGSNWIVFYANLPSTEITKLSCASGPYASFYIVDGEHRQEMYKALLYAMENNKSIYFSVTENSGICEVTLVNIYSKE